jgi:hypothetical protein
MKKLRFISLTTILLILFFAIYTYLDRSQLYENIGLIVISSNLAAYLIPPLVLAKYEVIGNSFAKTLIKILVPSLISIPIFICLVCIFNIMTVSNFLHNIPLYQFIVLTSLTQLAYALVSALLATVVLKTLVRNQH